MTFYDGATPLGTVTLNAAGLGSLMTSMVAVGTRSITAVYNGNGQYAGSTSPARTQTVNAAATASTLTISATSLQYSDRMTYEVTVTGANGEAPAQGVNFTIGMQPMNDAPVPFVNMGGGTWKATYANHPLLETVPGGSVAAQRRDQNCERDVQRAECELYACPRRCQGRRPHQGRRARGLRRSAARVDRRRRDGDHRAEGQGQRHRENAGGDGDTTVGNIQLARVTIVNRSTGAVIASNVPVVLDPDDPDGLDGVATYNWNVNIGTNLTQTFNLGFIVVNYYTRNSTLDNSPIIVNR